MDMNSVQIIKVWEMNFVKFLLCLPVSLELAVIEASCWREEVLKCVPPDFIASIYKDSAGLSFDKCFC